MSLVHFVGIVLALGFAGHFPIPFALVDPAAVQDTGFYHWIYIRSHWRHPDVSV